MNANPLAIKKVSVYKLSVPLKKPFVISLGPITHAHNMIVVMETAAGIKGTGECSPFMTINGESQQTCFTVAQYLAKGLKNRDATDIAGNHEVMNKIIYGNTSAKSAFDIAMYDIAAQHANQPLYRYLGGKKNRKIISDYTISIGEPEVMAAEAATLKQAGFAVIKVKLGGDPDVDILRMRSIRKSVGNKIALRIDANQGWNVADAIRVLRGMRDLDIQYCEEPIPRWDFMNLKVVRSKSPVKIMADESCFDEHDAARLIGLKACDMFNLKLGKSSGIFRAQKIIGLADQAGMDMQIGGFMECRIAMTANAHLALSCDRIRYFDLDTPLMFTSDPVAGGIRYEAGGRVIMPDGNGLGAYIPEKTLNKLEKVIV